MSDMNNGGWPFAEDTSDEGLDYSAIFGGGTAAGDTNPFDIPAAQAEETTAPFEETPAEIPAEEPTLTDTERKEKTTVPISASEGQEETSPAKKQEVKSDDPSAEVPNPIEAAFAQKTTENTRQGLLEKLPIFCHKNVKEPIEDTSQTFEDLRIRKSEDFADLEEGKYVSWSVDYCGIRKEIKDPKGSTIASVKETIEQSREFLQALKKFKGKTPECLVKPKVVMKTKGTASYKGKFQTVEEARASDKVICLIPSSDGRFYELRKTEQGEFIAPKNKVVDFQQVRAGFIPALPLIPLSLIGTITAFFRAFMQENEEYEALALIYWDKVERRFFSYVPKQTVSQEHIDADLRNCPYDDDTRYIRYADIHSHNSMEAFFSSVDDMDERGTGLYLVMGELNRFFPDIKARISCGGSFVDISPALVIEGLESEYSQEWEGNVTRQKDQYFPASSHKLSGFLPTALEEKL